MDAKIPLKFNLAEDDYLRYEFKSRWEVEISTFLNRVLDDPSSCKVISAASHEGTLPDYESSGDLFFLWLRFSARDKSGVCREHHRVFIFDGERLILTGEEKPVAVTKNAKD